jgi:hypothetical protein
MRNVLPSDDRSSKALLRFLVDSHASLTQLFRVRGCSRRNRGSRRLQEVPPYIDCWLTTAPLFRGHSGTDSRLFYWWIHRCKETAFGPDVAVRVPMDCQDAHRFDRRAFHGIIPGLARSAGSLVFVRGSWSTVQFFDTGTAGRLYPGPTAQPARSNMAATDAAKVALLLTR